MAAACLAYGLAVLIFHQRQSDDPYQNSVMTATLGGALTMMASFGALSLHNLGIWLPVLIPAGLVSSFLLHQLGRLLHSKNTKEFHGTVEEKQNMASKFPG